MNVQYTSFIRRNTTLGECISFGQGRDAVQLGNLLESVTAVYGERMMEQQPAKNFGDMLSDVLKRCGLAGRATASIGAPDSDGDCVFTLTVSGVTPETAMILQQAMAAGNGKWVFRVLLQAGAKRPVYIQHIIAGHIDQVITDQGRGYHNG